MTIRPTPQARPFVDDARPGLPTIPRQTASNKPVEFKSMIDNGGSWSSDRGELDNPHFDESFGL